MKIKTFRGKLADNAQDQIYLSGGESDEGYRIHKFQIFQAPPGVGDVENVLQIFSVRQTGNTSGTPDFSDDTLLGAAYLKEGAGVNHGVNDVVVFDNIIFNQDIYITQRDMGNSTPGSGVAANYYLELEEVKMSNPEAAVVNYKAALLHGE